jgi:hypothetical protein
MKHGNMIKNTIEPKKKLKILKIDEKTPLRKKIVQFENR